jgi:uncharacterized membrane protein
MTKNRGKTMTLESSKTLGGVGAILILVGTLATSYSYGVITLVGVILVFIALNGLANFYKERSIFSYAIYSLVAGIVGVVASVAAILYIIFDTKTFTNLLEKLYPNWNGNWSTIGSAISGHTAQTANITTGDITSIIGAVFLVLVILWVFAIVAAFFARRSLKTLSTKTSVGLFSTGGLLLLIGAFLTIIGIGFILMWIAALLIAIAFFQIKPQSEQPVTTMTPPPSTPTPV